MSFQTRLLPDSQDLTRLCQHYPDRYPFALNSTAESEDLELGRYDIYFAYPQGSLELDYRQQLNNDTGCALESDRGFLHAFEQWWSELHTPVDEPASQLPFRGGWFVFLSYEMAMEIEPCLQLPTSHSKLPRALAVRCPAAIIVDHQMQQRIAVAEADYAYLLDNIEHDCRQLHEVTATTHRNLLHRTAMDRIIEANAQPYLEQVKRIKQYIRDGDIFQANLSRPWTVEIDKAVDNVDIYRQLSRSNPGSFAALAQLAHGAIISSSPERLVRCIGTRVETRPIAGTRPRADENDADRALAEELLAHPKEQAEHIMLIDLERNDLGRICKPGSVRVSELMTLESYRHVHHIVSNVEGEMNAGTSPVDVIRAVFPGGTITGCPKIRCMEILAEMEQQARGAYTGSLGYINRDGSMDLNILIRTMVRENGHVRFRAGGGIVADSSPEHELEETRAKAKGLLYIFQQQADTCEA